MRIEIHHEPKITVPYESCKDCVLAQKIIQNSKNRYGAQVHSFDLGCTVLRRNGEKIAQVSGEGTYLHTNPKKFKNHSVEEIHGTPPENCEQARPDFVREL